MAFIVLMGWHF